MDKNIENLLFLKNTDFTIKNLQSDGFSESDLNFIQGTEAIVIKEAFFENAELIYQEGSFGC